MGVCGWELWESAGSQSDPSLNPPTGIQAEDAYKTHILLNGKHPITVFESADAVDQVFATTGALNCSSFVNFVSRYVYEANNIETAFKWQIIVEGFIVKPLSLLNFKSNRF